MEELNLYEVIDLQFRYSLGAERFTALHDITFNIASGEMVCFSGPSGSGKTTLLNILGLIEPIQKGEVLFKGNDISSLSEKKKNELRRHHIGFIFQQFHLLPVLSAEENVEYFLASQKIPKKERKLIVAEALHQVGLSDHRKKRPSEMSGGQRQRVAIARAIAKKPTVIIADEPTASLDQKTGYEVMQILQKHCADSGVTILIASHDPMVHKFAKKQLHVRDGRLYEGSYIPGAH